MLKRIIEEGEGKTEERKMEQDKKIEVL